MLGNADQVSLHLLWTKFWLLKNGVPRRTFSSTSTSLTCQPPSPESMHMLTI